MFIITNVQLLSQRFGIVIGGITLFAGLLLLVLNLWTFPTPPGESGLIDVGPFVGLWFLVLNVRVLFSAKWWTNRYVGGSADAIEGAV